MRAGDIDLDLPVCAFLDEISLVELMKLQICRPSVKFWLLTLTWNQTLRLAMLKTSLRRSRRRGRRRRSRRRGGGGEEEEEEKKRRRKEKEKKKK